jgi:HEAT repeat protein
MKKWFLVFAAVLLVESALFAQEQPPEKPVAPASPTTDNAKLQEEIDSLVKQLSSDDWQTRENATKRLTEIGAPTAPTVAALRTSQDIEVRVRAAKILDSIYWVSPEDSTKIEGLVSKYVGEPGSELAPKIDELTKKLSSEDFKTREEATKELIEIGRPALSAVEKLKESDDAEVKTRAERIAIEIVKKTQELEAEIIKQIKEIKHSDFYLLNRLCPASADKSREAKIAQILSGLLNLSTSQDGGDIIVRRQGQGTVVIVTKKLKILGKDGKARVVINGKEITENALKKDAEPAEVLVAIVRDEEQNSELRTRAARALAARDDKCTTTSLVNALPDLKDKFQATVVETLRKLTGQNFGPLENSSAEERDKGLQEWKEWLEKNKEDKTYRFKDQQANAPDESDEFGGILKKLRKEGNLPKEAEELQKKPQGEKEKQKEKENPPQKPEKEKEF